MCLPLVRRLRVCLWLERAERVATRARAFEEMRRSMHELRIFLRSHAGRLELSCSMQLTELGESDPINATSAGSGVKSRLSTLATCTSGLGTTRGCVFGCADLSLINEELV
eukprot:1304217-Pleurochrysis_carterae.AAC.1